MEFKRMKFDVAAVAKELGVQHEHASRIIQEVLFEQGYAWYAGAIVQHIDRVYLHTNQLGDITYGNARDRSAYHAINAETCSIKATYVVFSNQEVVTFNGKEYNKEDLEKALALLTPVDRG